MRFYIRKKFILPIGHRLMKHEGKCQNCHGHNFEFEIQVSCEKLDGNEMVVDFAEVKRWFDDNIKSMYDHAVMLNQKDHLCFVKGIGKVVQFIGDPTAEQLAYKVYDAMLGAMRYTTRNFAERGMAIDYVEVWENGNSIAGYRR